MRLSSPPSPRLKDGAIMPETETRRAKEPKMRPEKGAAAGSCLCGAVRLAIETPAFWAWHDHSAATRCAHGAAYATYIGVWRSKVRILEGEDDLARFIDDKTGSARSFCRRCGTPLIYERRRDKTMVNLPRALFEGRTGREPRYHIGIEEMREWIYLGAPLAPLKGYPGVMQERPRRRRAKRAGL
jgi:hypothetical protein